MTIANSRPHSHANRFFVVVMALVTLLAAFAVLAPQADAAKKKQRIVAISPFAAQTMIQLGVKPIRVGETIGYTDRQKRLFRGIGMLKLSHPNGPNLEQMARLRPDIVFSSNQWQAGHNALRRLGIRVVVADPLRPQQVYGNIRKVGRIIGRQRQANRLVRSTQRQVKAATPRVTSRENVLVVLGIGRTAMAFLPNSWGGQIVQLAGGRLVTGGAKNSGGFARISDEVVVANNPDRIIIVPHGTAQDIGQVAEYVKNNQAWQSTDAVKNGKVFVSTDNSLLQAGTDVGPTIRRTRSQLTR